MAKLKASKSVSFRLQKLENMEQEQEKRKQKAKKSREESEARQNESYRARDRFLNRARPLIRQAAEARLPAGFTFATPPRDSYSGIGLHGFRELSGDQIQALREATNFYGAAFEVKLVKAPMIEGWDSRFSGRYGEEEYPETLSVIDRPGRWLVALKERETQTFLAVCGACRGVGVAPIPFGQPAPTHALIVADWLEERGYAEAAKEVRESFR